MTFKTSEDDLRDFAEHRNNPFVTTEVFVADEIEEIDPTEYGYERTTDPGYDDEYNGHVLGDPDEIDDEILEWAKEV